MRVEAETLRALTDIALDEHGHTDLLEAVLLESGDLPGIDTQPGGELIDRQLFGDSRFAQ